MSEFPKDGIPVGLGGGVAVSVVSGSGKEKVVRVMRGALCSDWFEVAIGKTGHLALADDGSPVLSGMAEAASDAGWQYVSHGPGKKAVSPSRAVLAARGQGKAKGLKPDVVHESPANPEKPKA